MAAIHRQVVTIAEEQGWKPPSYDCVRQIIKNLDPALLTMAHQGAAAYREEFDLLYRRESPHSNAMWQADHTPLDVLLLDEHGQPAKPWLTAIEDDYSRAIVGYRLSFQEATALTTALTLAAFEQRFRTWLLDDYHQRIHEETGCKPAACSRTASVFKDIATSIQRWPATSKRMW
jgi:hypothetical protein